MPIIFSFLFIYYASTDDVFELRVFIHSSRGMYGCLSKRIIINTIIQNRDTCSKRIDTIIVYTTLLLDETNIICQDTITDYVYRSTPVSPYEINWGL